MKAELTVLARMGSPWKGAISGLKLLPRCLGRSGLVGAVQVYAGLTLVNKVGAGPFVGITVTAALIASILIDHFGWFRMDQHPFNLWRGLGAVLLIGGVTLIAKF